VKKKAKESGVLFYRQDMVCAPMCDALDHYRRTSRLRWNDA
jgi:hypothetical protein